jgi:serine/threonine-protein kinase RsbW
MYAPAISETMCDEERSLTKAETNAGPRVNGCNYCAIRGGDGGAREPVFERIGSEMHLGGYTSRQQEAVHIAVTEAVANAYRHGNRRDPEKVIHLWYTVDAARVWIRVADDGRGFDVDGVPDPTAAENLRRPSGRGLFLMRHFVDLVEYNGCGNVVTLVKYRSGSEPIDGSKTTSPAGVTVMLVDGEAIVRRGLRREMKNGSGLTVVGETGDPRRAEELLESLAPVVVLLDLGHPPADGIDVIRRIRERDASVRIVCYSIDASPALAAAALAVGASAYLFKNRLYDEVREAIGRVLCGQTFVSPQIKA